MASADLGGLAPREAATVFVDWVAPSRVPQLLPWVAILALLLLKPNRCASAWWIWVPVAVVGWGTFLPNSVEGPPSVDEMCEVFLGLIGALGFGLAAVWLLSSYLAGRHRMVAWLGILVAQGLFGGLPYLLRAGFEPQTLGNQGVFFALGALVISVALSLARWVCRGRYGWLRVCARLLAVLVAASFLVMAPLFILEMIDSRDAPAVGQPVGGVVAISGVTFGALLPFLVLSRANGFHRERLKSLLGLEDAPPSPVINPPMPTVSAASRK